MNARHPLHPAIVHFPIACWSLAAIADYASQWYGQAAWQWSAGLLVVGCGMALPAMIAGLVEVPRVPEGPALRDTWMHIGFILAAFSCFAARLLLRLDRLQPLAPNAWSLLLDAGGFLSLIVGGWIGGRLVHGHGIGRALD